MALAAIGTSSAGVSGPYTLVGSVRGERANQDGTFTPIVTVTAQSATYGVVFTFTVLASTWDADGGPPLIEEKTGEVDAVCAHPHVVDFRTEQDQGPSQVLYNYAVITVGTADLAITDDTRVRMDHLGLPSTFGAIDAVWNRLAAAGAQ